MYRTILVTVDGTPTDRAILEHIKPLAKLAGSHLVLFHVVTSAAAKFHGSEAAGHEVTEGEAYLAQLRAEFAAGGLEVETELAFGDPAKEIINRVKTKGCDLVAMSTHGHKFMADLVLGTTAIKVQHGLSVPVLLLRAK